MKTIEHDGRSIENPAYCDHRRGRNWGEVMCGKIAANCDREFLSAKGNIVDLEAVKVGDVIDFGGDYVSGSGRRHPDRLWWHVHDIDEAMKYAPHASLANVLKAARAAPTTSTKLEERA
jgi:hypothetical protein